MYNNALKIYKGYLEKVVKEGDCVIDATVGNGNDTLTLRKLVGDKGLVYGFDIQQEAIDRTKRLLSENGLNSGVRIYLASHSEMDAYIKEEIKAAVFNLGYLPGGDHKIMTIPETTIVAIEKALSLLRDDGIITLVIYHGGDSGFYERDKLLRYLERLNPQKYNILCHTFLNQPNYPPICIAITKNIG